MNPNFQTIIQAADDERRDTPEHRGSNVEKYFWVSLGARRIVERPVVKRIAPTAQRQTALSTVSRAPLKLVLS